MSDNQWHLDKKVPLGIIFAIVVQTLTLVVVGTTWKAGVDNRLDQLEKVDSNRASHESRIIILEQGISYIRTDLAEIKALLKREQTRP